MQCWALVAACVAAAALLHPAAALRGSGAHVLGHNDAVSPISKVVTLLTKLEATVIKDGEEEQAAFEAYSKWCQTGARDKEWEIKTAKNAIEDFTATIKKADADIASLTSKIDDLSGTLSTNEGSLKEQTAVREKEAEEFQASEVELVDAIDTLERATNILQRKLKGSDLLQAQVKANDVQSLVRTLTMVIDAAGLSLHDKKKLMSLTQSSQEASSGEGTDSDDEAGIAAAEIEMGAPAPDAYTSHSESIIDVLEDLKQKAEIQLTELRKQEMSAKHNFDLMKQDLESTIKADTKELEDSKSSKLEAQETKAVAEGDLAVAQKDQENAEKVLKTMSSDCQTAAVDFEASVKSRGEELVAIREAIKAIQESAGGANAVAYNDTTPLSFLELHGVNFEVVNLVRKLAKETASTNLAQLAGRISTLMKVGAQNGDDPFAKVKALISDMIERLTKEAGEEAAHKAYCDKEMAGTEKKTRELNHDVDTLSAKIDSATSHSAKLKDEVAGLSREIAEISKSQAEADAIRQKEHAAYVTTKADLDQGLQGIRMALKILRDYYVKGESTLLQQPTKPGTHSASAGAGTTIIGMLEVVEADLGRSLAQAEIDEESAAVDYQKLTLMSKTSLAMKKKDVEYKTKEAGQLDQKVLDLTSDKNSVQTELDAVLEYTKNIRGMCVLKPESYEDRATRREQEIAGLKEALAILEGSAVLLQQKGHGVSLGSSGIARRLRRRRR